MKLFYYLILSYFFIDSFFCQEHERIIQDIKNLTADDFRSDPSIFQYFNNSNSKKKYFQKQDFIIIEVLSQLGKDIRKFNYFFNKEKMQNCLKFIEFNWNNHDYNKINLLWLFLNFHPGKIVIDEKYVSNFNIEQVTALLNNCILKCSQKEKENILINFKNILINNDNVSKCDFDLIRKVAVGPLNIDAKNKIIFASEDLFKLCLHNLKGSIKLKYYSLLISKSELVLVLVAIGLSLCSFLYTDRGYPKYNLWLKYIIPACIFFEIIVRKLLLYFYYLPEWINDLVINIVYKREKNIEELLL